MRFATEEPKVAAVVSPRDGTIPCSWNVSCGGSTHSTVDTNCVRSVTPTDPSPFAVCRTELPQVVQVSLACARSITVATEEPKVATVVSPRDGTKSRSGCVAG